VPADLDALQLAGVPAQTSHEIDFGTTQANAFKWYGISEPVTPSESAPLSPSGFAVLRDRQPSSLRFTMQGLMFDASGPPIRSAALRMRLPARPITLELDVSTQLKGQELSIAVNGHEIVHAVPVPAGDTHTISADVPAAALSLDGLQVITLTHTQGSVEDKVFPLCLHHIRWR
jgi:hypothetical protein